MNIRQPRILWQRLGSILLLVVCVGGCAGRPVADGPHPTWPPQPASPRVVHRHNLRGPADLGQESWLSSLGRLITGRARQTMVRPNGVDVSADGMLYVTDQELQGVHAIHMPSGTSSFIARANGEYFVSPVGVAVCEDRIAVSDSVLNKVFLFSTTGKPIGQLEKAGGFERPTGLAYDADARELYVVDTLANQVFTFDQGGKLVRSFGASGTDIGQFNYPTHVFVDAAGKVYVTDSMNFRIQVFNRKGQCLFVIGKHGDASGHVGVPKGVAVDSLGHIYVVDSYFSTVQIFDRQGRFLLGFGEPGRASGQFQVPTGMTIGADNRIYVCDSFNRRVQIFQYVGGPDNEIDKNVTP